MVTLIEERKLTRGQGTLRLVTYDSYVVDSEHVIPEGFGLELISPTRTWRQRFSPVFDHLDEPTARRLYDLINSFDMFATHRNTRYHKI